MAQPLRVLQQEQLSDEAGQLATQYSLGAPTADYKVVLNKEKRTYIIIGIVGTLLCGAASGIFFAPTENYNVGVGLLCIAFALFCLGMAVRYATYPLRYKTWHIYTCDNGFIFSKGGKAEVFPWEKIESFWQQITQHKRYGMNIGMTHKYTVRRSDGTEVILDDKFGNVDKLGETINEEIIKVKLPQAIAAFASGQVLSFGPISISPQGVTKGKDLLPWDQIKRIYVADGYFIIDRDKKLLNWANIEASKIPNVLLLSALITHFTLEPEDDKEEGTSEGTSQK